MRPATSSAPLFAYEGLTAFFLEAAFLGVLLFGRKLVPPLGAFRRRPDGRAAARCSRPSGSSPPTAGCRRRPATRSSTAASSRRTGSAIIFNPSFPYRLAHTVTGFFVTTAFVVLGVGAWLIRQRTIASRKRASCCR